MESRDNQRPPRRSLRKRQTSRRHESADVVSSSSRQHNPVRNVIDLTSDGPEPVHHGNAGTENETVSEDDICPICQLLLYRPVMTSCNHTLCESCMATWADVSVTTQMQIVDVDQTPTPFNAISGLEARCPMCRTQTSAALNDRRLRELKTAYPRTYSQREAEEATNIADGDAGEIQTLALSIGNRHRLVTPTRGESNTHEWDFFVRPSRTDIIEEVHIHLHPSFRQSRIIRTRAPYEIQRLGWGYFTIGAYVILKAGYSWVSSDAVNSPDGAEKGMLPLEWGLDFTGFGGRGSMGRLRLKVRNQRDWDDVSEEEVEDERVSQRLRRQYEADGRYVPEEEP